MDESPPTVRTFRLVESESFDEIRQYLQGRVFHVTAAESLSAIRASQHIYPNRDGVFASPFSRGSTGYFRQRGYVSLFDYRREPNEELADFRRRCNPLMPAMPPRTGAAILVLDPSAYGNLIGWEAWKHEKAFADVVVPYVEAGYPGPLPLRLIAEIVEVYIDEDPNCFAAIVRRSYDDAS